MTSNCCSLWIQALPKKILYPPKLYPCRAFLAADPWIHRGWFFVVVSIRLLFLDVSRCEVKHPGCWVFPIRLHPKPRGGNSSIWDATSKMWSCLEHSRILTCGFSNLKKHGDFRTFIDIEGWTCSPEDPWDWAYLPTFTMNRTSPMQYIYMFTLNLPFFMVN